MFEASVKATMDEMRNHSIQPEELLACYTTFELLPNQAKQALKNSRWWVDVIAMRDKPSFKIQDAYPTPQPLQWKHLIDTLVASFFPSQVQPNRYLKMFWGVQQECSEPFAAFLPRVVDLVTTVSGRGVEMWTQEDHDIFSDSFRKGLWDFETSYMDRYFTREWVLLDHSKDQLMLQARQLDLNHPPSARSHPGSFHSWRQWIHHC